MSENLPRVYSEAVKAFNDSDKTTQVVTITADTTRFRHGMDDAWWATTKLRGVPGDRELRPDAWPRFRPFRWRYGRRKR